MLKESFSKKVGNEEIEKLMNEGWGPVMTLPDGIVVTKTI
jgi:hypothetical protein